MKLNNQQITALADKFRQELIKNKEVFEKEEIEKYYLSKKLLFNASIKILEKNPFLNKVEVKLEKGYSNSINKDSKYNNWISTYNMANNLLGLKISVPTIEELKTNIVLATIESDSVEEIMGILKTKFK